MAARNTSLGSRYRLLNGLHYHPGGLDVLRRTLRPVNAISDGLSEHRLCGYFLFCFFLHSYLKNLMLYYQRCKMKMKMKKEPAGRNEAAHETDLNNWFHNENKRFFSRRGIHLTVNTGVTVHFVSIWAVIQVLFFWLCAQAHWI